MSKANAAEVEADVVCGWCGIAEVDNIKLEDCDGCDLVKYCGDNCRGEHRHWHAGDCKYRAKELHDRKLFTQPDISHHGECPLCFLPLPLDASKSILHQCCSKLICDGCAYVHHVQDRNRNCPFCREPVFQDDDEHRKRMMERVKANDPVAMSQMGGIRYNEGDYDVSVEYWAKSAELGDMEAHFRLGVIYMKEGVEKDEEKAVYHYEKAAIGGHPTARHNLGCYEEENGNIERAVKHFIIAANLGDEGSMKKLWKHYSCGNIAKEDLEATLRTHKAAIDAMKSPEREAAEAWRERQRGA
jgi:TPR repeat protein